MQRQSLAIFAISCVLTGFASAQTANPGTPPSPPRAEARQAAVAPAAEKSITNTTTVPMDTAVITLKGGCQPIGDLAPAGDCVSDVTRAQFEKLANALQPGMGADAKRGLAINYGRLLVYADAARALNLETNPDVQQIMQFVSNQVLAEALKRHYAEQYAHLTDQQIQDYYNQNSPKYVEATLERVIVPHNPGGADKPAPSDADQKAGAEKIRQRWVAGEDPSKLQQAAYESAGVTAPGSPEVTLGARQPGSLPKDQESVFQLKTGEISQIYSDPAAYYIYKVMSTRVIPLSEVKDTISKTLEQRMLQDKLEEIGKSATPVLNNEYFGAAPPPTAMATPALRPAPTRSPSASHPPK